MVTLKRISARAFLAASAAAAAWSLEAAAPGPGFWSSFEPGDPQPSLASVKAMGVEGAPPAGFPGSVMERVVEVTASGENAAAGEVKENLVDGDVATKWLAFEPTGWVRVHARRAGRRSCATRSPRPTTPPSATRRTGRCKGSADGTDLDDAGHPHGRGVRRAVPDQDVRPRRRRAPTSTTGWTSPRNGGDGRHPARRRRSSPTAAPPPPPGPRTCAARSTAARPARPPPRRGAGLHRHAARCATRARTPPTGRALLVQQGLRRRHRRSRRHTELSYRIFPVDDRRATCATRHLRRRRPGLHRRHLPERPAAPLDQHGVRAQTRRARAPPRPSTSTSGTTSVADRHGRGGQDHRPDPGRLRQPEPARRRSGAGSTTSRIARRRPDAPPTADLVRLRPSPRRGTQLQRRLLARQQLPRDRRAARLQLLDPGDQRRLHELAVRLRTAPTTPTTCPTLQAFSASHEPSPWMGDRQTFQVMPSAAAGTPDAARAARALAVPPRERARAAALLRRDVRERPQDGDRARPTTRRCFRFTFPGDGRERDLRQRQQQRRADPRRRRTRVVTGFSDVKSGLSAGATRHVRATACSTSRSPRSGMLPTAAARDVTGYFRFDAGADRTVTLRIATSLISVDQAKQNLALEIAAGDTFESVKERAQAAWDDMLGIVEVEGATADQLDHALLQPLPAVPLPELRLREHRHRRQPAYQYASPFSPQPGQDTPTADRREDRRRQGVRQQRLLGHLPHDLARLLAAHAATGAASWSTASSSSTRTAAGSPAGPRPATRT